MKQSTFSAVMANSIKNLWQGYTKGIRFVAVLTVLLTMGIGQAWGAEATYTKVTSAPADWSGEYLIVYEAGGVAFNGALTTLDAVSNTISVTISDNQIAATDAINNATFTINASGHVKSASGYYIGQTSNANGLKSSTSTTYSHSISLNNDGTVNLVSGGAYLRYNSASNQWRFRYYKSSSYTGQKAICLYKKVASCTAPTSVTIDGAWDKFGGETISLTATAIGGLGNYTYQWQKYYDATWNNITDNTTATTANLVYANCNGGNSGTYRCVVSTGADCSKASDGLQVKVYTLECYTNGTNIYHFTRNGNTQSGTLTLNLNANIAYKFKVHVDNDYYGNGGTINKDETNWVLGAELGTPDLTVNSGLGGTFTFTIDYSESGNSNTLGVPEISVTYPRKTIYLNPGVWDTDGAKYAIYYFIDGHDAWSDLLVGDACGTYTTIPQWNGVTMIAVRLMSDATGGTWDKKWNQTDNIAVTNNDYIAITGWGNNGGNSPHTYSTYTPATYSITFNGNGNTGGSMTEVTGITCGGSATLTQNTFTRTGYTFAGWATSANGEKVYDDKATISNITSNIPLYAKWTPNANTAYTVKHYKQQLDGTYSGTPDETDNLTGTTAASVTPAVKSYTGFTAPSTQTVTIAADGSTVVTYQYTRNSYTLTWNLDGGTISTQGTAAGEVKYGAALTAPTVTKTGHTFAGWSPAVAATMPAKNTTYTAQWTKVYTVTFYSNGSVYGETLTDLESGATVVFPTTDPTSCDTENYPHFIGWTINPINGSTDEQPDLVTSATVSDEDLEYHAVFAAGTPGTTSTKTDILTRATTGVTNGTTTYSNWSGKTATSSAVYAGQSAGSNDAIQLRSKNSNSGIITTASGGKATKVVVSWNSNTSNGRTLNIYGKNSPYEAATDLYDTNTQGTLLGTIVKGTSEELTITGDYEYIGLRSNSDPMYLDEIQITWSAGSAANYTSFITSCCQSPAVVTVTPADASLELDIDGTASTTVNISQTGGGSGRYYEPTVSPTDGASLDWAALDVTYKQTAYDINFTATKAGTYTVTGNFTETSYSCQKTGSATITVAANPILQVSAEELTFTPTCGQNSASQEVEINSRYLTANSITATVATTSGSGKFTISTDNSTFGTSNLTLSGGITEKVTDQIYVRYEAAEGETGAVAGTLTLQCGSTQQVINLTGTCTCSANVTITGGPIQITAAEGVWVEAATELTVTGTFLTTNADNANVSIRAYTNNAAFQIKKSGVTGEGAPKTASNDALTLNTDGAISTADWTGNIGIVYKPAQANTTETATLTIEVYRHNGSAIYSTATYELEGRSLPEQFVIAVTNGSGDWFAVPADMIAPWGNACSGLGTFAPYPIGVDNTTAPTIASDVPARAVYQAAARTGNVNTNPQTMSYKSVPLGGNYYLYGSSTSVESDGSNTNIQNASFAASEKQKWFLDVVDWNTKQYNMHVHSSLTTNVLAYTTAGGANCVGQYSATAGTTKKSIYLLPITGTTCTYYAAPVVTVTAIDATNATIQFKNDRTTAYEISMDQNTWTDLPVTLIKDCNNSEEATQLQAQLPLATYRGKTVYIRAKVTTGTACQETGSFVVPNPTIDRGETPWKYTGMAGQAFSDNSKSITISDLWNPLSVSVVQQRTNSNIQASITPEGVVTVSMAAEDATEGVHEAVLQFISDGASFVNDAQYVGVQITLHSLALQEFDGGDYNTFWEGMLCKDLIDFTGGTPTIHLSYHLYLNGSPISTTAQLNQTAFSLVDLVTGESLTISRDGNTGSGVAFVTIPTASVAKMVPGHTYRLSWENTNQVMTDKNGLPYMDCHMDFVYSENCDAPTALPACPITNSGFTANWAPVADCTGDVTVDVYTRGGHSVLVDMTTFTDVKDLKSATTSDNVWITNVNNDNEGAPSTTTNGLLISDVSTPKYYNLFSPLLSKLGTIDESVIYTITVVLYQQTVDAGAGAYFYVMDNGNTLTKNTIPTITNKSVTIDGQTATYKKLTSGTTTFTVKGLSSDDRIRFLGFEISSIATNKKNVYISSITIEASGSITPVASKTISCNAGSAEFTGLSANTTYYYTVGDGNGNNSNEIEVTTYSGAPSLKYYSDEACTTEITETKVLGGEETTVYVKGTNISACELVPSVTTGYAYDDSGLSYIPSTGDVSGKIILTLTDPANTISGTLTIAGFPLDLISSDCPAGFNNMANDATNVTSNSAQANWNSGLNFGDDPSGTLLLYENGEVFVELVENGDFETGSLTDGWSSSIHTGPSDGNKAFNEYELVNDNDEYSLYIKDNANCGTLANFHNMTLMYANYVTLKPGTYRMKAQVKVPEVSGRTDKEKIFAIGLVQSGLSVVAVSPEETVLSNNTYDEIIYEFELANEMTVCPAIGARQEAGEFRKFYIDNVSLMRIKCPERGDLVREIPITDLGTGFEDIEGLKPNTEYTYVIKNVDDCESNEITFYTGQGNYMPMQVVEWKEKSVVVMYTGSETNAIVMIGSNTPQTVALTQQDVAIYEIPIESLNEHPTEKLYITIGEGFKAVTIPYIISATKDEDDLTTNRDLARTSDIVILNEGKLNITKTGNAAYQYHDITIYGGGKMIVEGEVKIASLTMRIGAIVNKAHQALYPQLVLKGQITNSSRQINLDYLTTYDRYYALSVPYPVLTESIHYPADIYGDNLTTGNKASFALQWYDGEARASENRKGWQDLKEPATLAPYQGYTFWGAPRKVNGVRPTFGIHRIPMPVEDLTIKNNETSSKQINVFAHHAANAYDAGWNFIGNPYLAQYGNMKDGDTSGLLGMLTQNAETGVWEHTGNYRYITLTDDGKTYWQTPVSEAELYPFNTFFVQAGENGAVSFNASNRASLPARHYAAQQVTAKEITTGIILTGNDQTDRTGLLIADNFTEEYEFNADLSKFENSGINLYTIGKTGNLAYMAINQALAEQPIPVGYTAPAEGLYTIAFDEDRYNATDISALYLIDYDSNEKTNLLHTDYSFVTAAGTNNQRFALQVAFAPENATNVEWVGDATIQVGVEGNTLMLNNLPTDAAVHVFDALGRLMYHAPTVPTEMQLTLPTGYYLVRIADKQNAVVIKTVIP